MAALLFTSSVCVGLLLTLLAVSVRVSCSTSADHRLGAKPHSQEWDTDDNDDDDEEEEEDDDEVATGTSKMAAAARKALYDWEEVTYMSEAAERAERIERREMIIQEIWMNAYLNGNSW